MIQFLLVAVIQGLGAALALILNVVLARLLGVAEYGRYMTLLSVALILGSLAARGVNGLLTRELAARGCIRFLARDQLIRWAVIRVAQGISIAIALYLVWVFFGQSDLSVAELPYSASLSGVSLIGISALCLVEAGAINGLMAPIRSQALVGVIRNAGVLALVGLSYSLFSMPHAATQALWLQASGFLIAAITGAYWLQRLSQHIRPGSLPEHGSPANTSALRSEWARAAHHFLLIALASILTSRFDVVLVSSIGGSVTAGVYAAGARLAEVALMVALAVNVVLSPKFAAAYKVGNTRQLKHLLRIGFLFTVPLAIVEVTVVLSFASEIITLFGHDYTHAARPFVLVTVAYALWAIAAPGYSLLSMTGSEQLVSRLSWLVLIANVTAILVLVPSYGADGAAAAMLVGYLVVLPFLIRSIRTKLLVLI